MTATPESFAPALKTVASQPTLLSPVESGERLASIDVLRGVALCGILTINICLFALPSIVFTDPSAVGGWDAANQAVWIVSHLLCEQKMMSLFSMLFGAGLIVMVKRSEARGSSLLGIYYRRTFWLLLFGLAHAYLLWIGDILVTYALCGFVLYPFRRMRPRTQFILGACVFLSQVVLMTALGLFLLYVQNATGPDNTEGTPQMQAIRVALDENLYNANDAENVEKEIEHHREGYWQQLPWRALVNLQLMIPLLFLWGLPRAGGLMLIGMGLMQLGVFSAARSFRFYALLALIGYGIGFPIVGYGIADLISHRFDLVHQYVLGEHFNYVGSLFVALGHVGSVMLICKAGKLPRLTARFAAVGRMALTNYFMQTILCTTLFEGWGFGLFNELYRLQLLGVVASIWLLQLIVSPLWLRHFHFGPMEWLWRSLTYGRRQPFRMSIE